MSWAKIGVSKKELEVHENKQAAKDVSGHVKLTEESEIYKEGDDYKVKHQSVENLAEKSFVVNQTNAINDSLIKKLNNHAENDNIHVTASEKQMWNEKETVQGAQIKATQALTESKAYTDAKLLGIDIPSIEGLETVQGAQAKVDAHASNKSNPHGVTKSQVGLSNVDNVKQTPIAAFQSHADDATIHVSTKEKTTWNSKETTAGAQTKANKALSDAKVYTDTKTTDMETTAGAQAKVDEHTALKNNPHGVTKAQVGLSNVDNVKQATKAEFDAHVVDKTNPHSVTKTQVGLPNVDNVKQMPIRGGTFTGVAKAQTNASYTTAQLRNVIAVPSGTNTATLGANGDIIIVYE